jgi:hypothetical protein
MALRNVVFKALVNVQLSGERCYGEQGNRSERGIERHPFRHERSSPDGEVPTVAARAAKSL